jgi:hypothetical protein
MADSFDELPVVDEFADFPLANAKPLTTYDMFGHFVPSAKRFGEAMVTPILHPVETYQNVRNLGLGLGQKLIPGEQPEEKYADAFG